MDKADMIQKTAEVMRRMYYEDVEFIYKFVTGYAEKKGCMLR